MSGPVRINGVSRMFDNDKALLVHFSRKPTDDELRVFHDRLSDRNMSDADLETLGEMGWDAIDSATRNGKSELRELGRFIAERIKARGLGPPCLAGMASGEPCQPDVPDTLRRCTICGFIVDAKYKAEFP